MQQNAVAENPPGLDRIKRVVVIMFENRSFDHIFGAMHGVNGLFQNGKINPEYYNLPNPLQPPSDHNLSHYPAPVKPSIPMAHDFNHDFGDGMMHDLFGPVFTITPACAGPGDEHSVYKSGYLNGAPTNLLQPAPPTYPEINPGFYSTYFSCKPQGHTALTYFKDGDLKVLSALAKNFVVCDNWFCDMPGHTMPNRCFMHCGTTGTVGIDDTDSGQNTALSIFELLNKAPGHTLGWKMYAPVAAITPAGPAGPIETVMGQLDTRFLAPDLTPYKGVPITEFAADCNNGNLPFYSFIMCFLPTGYHDEWTDTSMHPASLVQPGENLLAAVYNTLRKSKHWEDTLLVVTFDENGGIYDHVRPPTTSPPHINADPVTQFVTGACGNKWKLDSEFDFSLLGFRVPALLISPWLAAGVDNHQYQNTSVLRFLINRLNAESGGSIPHYQSLTERDGTAPEIESAFFQFGLNEMRDCPLVEPYETLPSVDPFTKSNAIPYADGDLTKPWKVPGCTLSATPVAYIQELLNIYVAPLPGHPDSGQKITRTFATNADVASYSKERDEAAKRFFEGRSDKRTP